MPRFIALLFPMAFGLWPTAFPVAFPQSSQPDTSAKAVIAKAASYVAQYQKEFAFLLANEHYSQARFLPAAPVSGSNTKVVFKGDGRSTDAEVFLTYVDTNDAWIFVRDVKTVNGEPVAPHASAQSLLQADATSDTLRRIKDLNSRYNVGRITRNFNEPTLALLVIGPAHRAQFKFTRKAIDPPNADHPDRTLVTIGFKETDRPTLIRDASGENVFTLGELVVEAETGVIRATRLSMKDGTITAMMETRYTLDPKLKMWLPSVFNEHYEQSLKAVREQIDCEARYTDYRRFEVTGRIK